MITYPFLYSAVVDSQPLHPYQAHILLFTLEHFGGVPRRRIVVQCTERVPADVRNTFVQKGYTVTNVIPYLDEAYCNKIAQLDSFFSADISDAEGVFLLDLDMAVLSPIDVSDRSVVWGKIVNKPLPRLSTLERIFSAAGVPFPDIVPCDWGIGSTFATNFNGGFLYVPCPFLGRIRASWRRWAEFLFGRPDVFDTPAQRRNIDQIAFALTMVSERIPYAHLTANWNFSCHNSAQRPRTYDPASPLQVLHYHHCLDAWGLVSPNFSDPAVHAAAERVNTALGEQNDLTFFDLYKQHRAQQAVAGVPFLRTPLFSEDSATRIRLNDKPRRLILHVGISQTDTKALQHYLDSQRADLAREGVWYPPSSNRKKNETESQPLVSALRCADEEPLVACIEEAVHDMPRHTHTVILTMDGIYTHWRDYTPLAKGRLRRLSEMFDFEMDVWFPEPIPFVSALFTQYFTNSMEGLEENFYSRSINFEETMRDDRIRGQLDFLGFYYETQNLFGQERVTPFLYSGDTIGTFLTHYDVRRERAVRMSEAGRRENAGLSAAGVRLMRWVNRWWGRLPQPRQERAETWVRRIDGVIGRLSPAFRLTEQQADLVNRYAGHGWAILQEECRKSAASRQAAR